MGSKKDRSPAIQRKNLLAYGYEVIFVERFSSMKADRAKLSVVKMLCLGGDEFVGLA